jgi:membrane associated rhomboid family serine protease
MHWFDKLERKYGRFAISNLMKYIVLFNALAFILSYIAPTGPFISKLMLIPDLVMKGEVWRLFTYIFIPPNLSPIWIIFALYFYYLIGTGLEQEWGSFKFNLYYFLGMIGTTIAAFITKSPATATYLNLSLFLAFARIYPDFEILVFFVLPVKVKYLAYFDWFLIITAIIFGPIPLKAAAAASLVNYFIFFGKDILKRTKNKREVYNNRQKFKIDLPDNVAIHKCTICGITEKDDPNMEFRYCSRCDGLHEYCMEHLHNHEHIKEDN